MRHPKINIAPVFDKVIFKDVSEELKLVFGFWNTEKPCPNAMSAHKAEVSTKIKDTQKSRFDVSMEKFFQLGLHRNEGTKDEDASVVGS